MRLSLPLLANIVALLGMIASVACAGQPSGDDVPGEQTLADENEKPMVNRIAIIDNSGDLVLVNPDGTGERRVTGDVRVGLVSQTLERGDSYSWPTWSKDGGRVAFSKVSIGASGAVLSVQVSDANTGQTSAVYDNELAAPVADGTPHYLYWSPNDRYLSLLSPTREGLGLFLKDFQADEAPFPVALGAPLYYHWAPDAARLAVHSGDGVTLREPDGDGTEKRVAVDAFNFRAPAFSPDGSRLAFGGIVGGVEGVFVADTDADFSQPPFHLIETQGLTAFAWAPGGSAIAVAEQTQQGAPVFNRLTLVSPDGTGKSTILEEQFLAFFWSPNGDRIAWVGLDAQARSMELNVLPVEGTQAAGESRKLFHFSPTGELFTLLSFFDQYAYSHSLWAPDGSALVVAGTDGPEPGRRNGSGPHGGQVYVVDAGTGEARRIASGKVAVWSWN